MSRGYARVQSEYNYLMLVRVDSIDVTNRRLCFCAWTPNACMQQPIKASKQLRELYKDDRLSSIKGRL